MSPPVVAATEPRVGQISAERVADLSTRTQQMRFLVAELGVTRAQAHRLIRAYEARVFVLEEFGPWLRRRGDLMVVRGKAQHAWRVTTS